MISLKPDVSFDSVANYVITVDREEQIWIV